MDEERQNLYIEVRIIRELAEKFHLSLKEVALLCEFYEVLPYIRAGWGIFHSEGDEAVLADVSEYLKARGAKLCAN